MAASSPSISPEALLPPWADLLSRSRASPAGAWATEVVPRLGCAGGVIGLILVNSTIPQVVKTSNGMLTSLSPAMWGRMAMVITPKAGALKAAQYGVMREMKLTMDKAGFNPGASTMLSFGVVGTFFQSIIYNTLIADMYKIYTGKQKEPMNLRALAAGIAPGFVWCFARESLSMGGGLWLGPMVKAQLQTSLKEQGVDIPEKPLRFLGGFMSGACTAFATQWIHNTTLMAGRMAAVGETAGAPLYTSSSLQAAYNEMGVRMFWANYPQRMCLIAGAVALLNMLDIFHRPDLIAMRAF